MREGEVERKVIARPISTATPANPFTERVRVVFGYVAVTDYITNESPCK